jgi:hypothetical protein
MIPLFALLGVLLALDLHYQGIAWRFFWSQTGEEEPLAQVRGMVEWVGNLTRPQPLNDPMIPIDHANVNPYGINTFLHQEVEAVKVEEQLRLIAAAGFGWIREEFTWEEIEVDGRGQFTDSRNDMDGDGTIDTISGWLKFDRIVDLAEKYDLRIQARLSNPPAWAKAPDVHSQTPPQDFQDFVNFAVAIAQRYQGRITHYQIWNEPNIFPEWGTNPDGTPRQVSPEEYTDLLCRTYHALKAVDPDLVVISGALAPTSELWGTNLNDSVYLERMYQAGAGECFDILSMQGYGLNSGPTDRRMRPTNVNFARNQYIRELMIRHGDGHKPIWISEAAWNPVPIDSEIPIANQFNFGQVTLEQAAHYMPIAYQRMEREWPWIGVMNYWYFTQPSDARKGESWYYFRMAEPDYSPEKPTYTTLPIYEAMKAHITGQTPTLYQGVHQMDHHWAVTYAPNSQVISLEDALFGEAVETTGLQFVAQGSEIRLTGRGGALRVWINDQAPQILALPSDQWATVTLHSNLLVETLTVRLEADTPLIIDTVSVIDHGISRIYPIPLGLILAIGIGLSAWYSVYRNKP